MITTPQGRQTFQAVWGTQVEAENAFHFIFTFTVEENIGIIQSMQRTEIGGQGYKT